MSSGFRTDMELADGALDGCGFSHQVPENEVSKASIRDFISTSIAPYITGATTAPESYPLLQELLGVPSTAARLLADQEQDTAILTDITSQAAIHGEEELGFGNIGRRDIEPYYPWTMSSSHSVSADHYPRFGDSDFPTFDVSTFGLGGTSIPVLQEPFQNQEIPEWPPSTSSNPHGSRKAREILVDLKQTLTFSLPTSQSLLQLEYLEKLRGHPTVQDSSQLLLPSTGTVSSGFQTSSRTRDSAWLPFQPNRHSQLLTRSFKRPAMIFKWVTALAPRMRERDGGLSGPAAALSSDPRSPNSRMLDQQAAVIHKHAERRRRSNMNNKLRTLISIVPTIEKKDKISVLTSTIDYIRQLTSRISSFEKKKAIATPSILATTSRMEEDALVMNMDSTLIVSSSGGGPSVVVDSSDGKTWLIKVEANYHSWSLLYVLNVFYELEFEVISMDYWTKNGQFQAHVSIKHSEKSSTSSSDLKETLSRVLESGNNLLTTTS